MSRTDTALKPLVENNSSAAHKIASRRFGLRAAAGFLRVGLVTIDLYQCTKDKVWSTKIMGVSTKPKLASFAAARRIDLIEWVEITSVGSTKQGQDQGKRSATFMLGLTRKFGCLVGATLLLAASGARADSFPSKPVHILVPYAAGGAVDVLARTLGQSLAKAWGQQPVIENRPGAGGIVASQALTQAAAGRHYVDPGREPAPAQSVHLSQIALRHLQGFYGHQRDCIVAARDSRLKDESIHQPSRSARRRAKRPGLAVLRHGR